MTTHDDDEEDGDDDYDDGDEDDMMMMVIKDITSFSTREVEVTMQLYSSLSLPSNIR